MSKLGRATDVVLVLVCSVALGAAGTSYLKASKTPQVTAAQAAPDVSPLIGKPLPDIKTLEASGRRGVLSFGQLTRPTLVLLFKSTCVACEANATNWQALTAAASRDFDVLVVSSEGSEVAAEWLSRHEISGARIVLPASNADVMQVWGVQAVPTTLVVGADGMVRYGHVGILGQGDLAAIHAAVGV